MCIRDSHSVVLYYRVCEELLAHLQKPRLELLAVLSVERELHVLADAKVFDLIIPEGLESPEDRLSLRVEYPFLQRHVDPGTSHIDPPSSIILSVSYTHLRAHETRHDLVCRL